MCPHSTINAAWLVCMHAELVPGGTGELVMIRAVGRGIGATADDEAEPDQAVGGAGPSTSGAGVGDKYSGVKVRVKFAGSGEAVGCG